MSKALDYYLSFKRGDEGTSKEELLKLVKKEGGEVLVSEGFERWGNGYNHCNGEESYDKYIVVRGEEILIDWKKRYSDCGNKLQQNIVCPPQWTKARIATVKFHILDI